MILVVLMIAASAQASVYTFAPFPNDLYNIDHNEAYEWGLDWSNGEEITGATLSFSSIYDWIVEPGDSLFIHLLDNPTIGTTSHWDAVPGSVDFFAGQGTLLDTYFDPAGGGSGVDLSYDFTGAQLAALNGYAADGSFGFGFDPDCHYNNGGIQLTVHTAVPEPTTMVLFGLGLVGVGVRRRFRKN